MIGEFKQRFPNSNLSFLDEDEWLQDALKQPRYALLNNTFRILDTCSQCRSQDGEFLGTEKCPGLTQVFNRSKSEARRAIIFDTTRCEYMLERDHKELEQKAFEASGLPPGWLESASLDTFNTSRHSRCAKAVETCRQYLDNFHELSRAGYGLYIYGPPQSGKTHLAVATSQEIMRRFNRQYRYTSVTRMISTYRQKVSSTFSGDEYDDPYGYVLEDLINFDGVLILDDLGSEVCTDATVGLLNTVVANRVDARLPTFITSYYSLGKDAGTYSLLQKYEIWGFSGSAIAYKIQQSSIVISLQGVPPYTL
jgi:DNA replication protein DnaC